MDYRIEKDSMGEMRVPLDSLYAAQTQRAVENFPISGLRFPRAFIRALALIKAAAAQANADLDLLPTDKAEAIVAAAREVAHGAHDDQFPIDVFQTGSGTSTNMNANEVIAALASRGSLKVHPNDDVNNGQSSNDVIPAAIHASAACELSDSLLPSLKYLHEALSARAAENAEVVKTGRTHLMDAMPITLGQEIGAWAFQIQTSIERLESTLPRLRELATGGTAVGTGINAHPELGRRLAEKLSALTGV